MDATVLFHHYTIVSDVVIHIGQMSVIFWNPVTLPFIKQQLKQEILINMDTLFMELYEMGKIFSDKDFKNAIHADIKTVRRVTDLIRMDEWTQSTIIDKLRIRVLGVFSKKYTAYLIQKNTEEKSTLAEIAEFMRQRMGTMD